MKNYKEIENRFKEMDILGRISYLLEWDTETYMPEKASDSRGNQRAYISEKQQEIILRPDWAELLNNAENETGLNEWQKENLRLAKRIWTHQSCLSAAFINKWEQATNKSINIWKQAKKVNDFKSWCPAFEEVLKLTREKAAIKSDVLKLSPYDTLLDTFQPDFYQNEIDPIFAELSEKLPPLIAQIKERQSQKIQPLSQDYTGEKQDRIVKQIAEIIGFDLTRGRIDKSIHGFTLGSLDDARITYTQKKSITDMILTVIHETGHALYEQNLPRTWEGQPVGGSLGMTMHESQSLFWERQIAQSLEFITFLTQKLKDVFGYDEILEAKIKAQMNTVRPSLIRIEADEVTYPLHIVMRYEIEKELISGKIEVKDLPDVWQTYMKKLLGIAPKTDTEGCLQDIHWPSGMIGYFPSYALGAITAAQWMGTLEKEKPEIRTEIAKGAFGKIGGWLASNLHQKGSLLPFDQLVKDVSGKPLTTKYFMEHIQNRYLFED